MPKVIYVLMSHHYDQNGEWAARSYVEAAFENLEKAEKENAKFSEEQKENINFCYSDIVHVPFTSP